VDHQKVWANRGIVISESCGFGASFQAERQDELKLLNAWRSNHKCRADGNLAIIDTSRNETSHPIGFLATGLVDPARSPYPDWDDE
jgi:hypothetical protein